LHVLRRPSSSARGVSVSAGNPANVAERTSPFVAMDVDVTNTPGAAADGIDVDSRSSRSEFTAHNQQWKRPAATDSDGTEPDDGRASKRRRQNSTTNTESSSSLSSVPADRSPINASFSSMLRYRTRVTKLLFPSVFERPLQVMVRPMLWDHSPVCLLCL